MSAAALQAEDHGSGCVRSTRPPIRAGLASLRSFEDDVRPIDPAPGDVSTAKGHD
jgi:hypothetical protein